MRDLSPRWPGHIRHWPDLNTARHRSSRLRSEGPVHSWPPVLMREAGCASQLGSCGSSGEIAGVLGIVHIVLAAMVAVICVARDNCMTGGLPSDFPQYRHVSKSLRFRYRGGHEFSTSDCPHCRIVEGAQHFSALMMLLCMTQAGARMHPTHVCVAQTGTVQVTERAFSASHHNT